MRVLIVDDDRSLREALRRALTLGGYETMANITRSLDGRLRNTDWNFSFWGYEEPDSFNSTFEEGFDRRVARLFKFLSVDAARGPDTRVRFIHEGGSASHNGDGTMIAVESVVMHRNLGPGRFCGGHAP